MNTKMRIRDRYHSLGDERLTKIIELGSDGIDIVNSEGRALFRIQLSDEGASIEINAGDWGRHEGVVYEDRIQVIPVCCNVVVIRRPEYKPLDKPKKSCEVSAHEKPTHGVSTGLRKHGKRGE